MTTAYVALGANLGDPLVTLIWARGQLGQLGFVTGVSALYATDPVGGPPNQPEYLNAVVRLDAFLEPVPLLRALHDIEAQAGRERLVRWAARTLDLDLLLYDEAVLQTPEITLPHPRAWERGFVLAPLQDIAPQLPHPLTGETVEVALARVGWQGVRRQRELW